MNILGVGNLELIWILLLALVLLGPGRMVDAARAAGKFWREAQHVLRAAADAATVNFDAPPPRNAPRDPLPEPEDAISRGGSGDETPDAAPESGGDDSPEAR
ncbi:MAG: twin-arginine translocase TatA/TatE family subunit [Chloroflexi bacterium]|nr:twin-arginine translocase TatA/TatE family subunit [Chloroflexota bacterium]